jgi:hypothetical protein
VSAGEVLTTIRRNVVCWSARTELLKTQLPTQEEIDPRKHRSEKCNSPIRILIFHSSQASSSN